MSEPFLVWHARDVSITFVGRGAQICTNPKLWWRRKPLGKNIGFSQSARNHLETNDIKPTVLQVIRSFKKLPGSKRSSNCHLEKSCCFIWRMTFSGCFLSFQTLDFWNLFPQIWESYDRCVTNRDVENKLLKWWDNDLVLVENLWMISTISKLWRAEPPTLATQQGIAW